MERLRNKVNSKNKRNPISRVSVSPSEASFRRACSCNAYSVVALDGLFLQLLHLKLRHIGL